MDGGMWRLILLIVGMALVLLAPKPGLAQIYTGLYVGAAIPHEADVSVTDKFVQDATNELNEGFAPLGLSASLSGISVSDIEFDAGVMVGGRVGYWLEALNAPFLGVEAEVYGAFPQASDQTLSIDTSLTVDGTSGAVNLSTPIEEADLDVVTVGFNLLGRYPSGPVQPYGGVGVGIVHAEFDDIKATGISTFTIDGISSSFASGGETVIESDDDTAPALQLMGGVRGFISDNVALFAEYKWVTTELEFQDIDVDYDASHVYGGVEFYFGPGVVQQ